MDADTIICGDARAVLREFPDGCFDACITDPPFGIGAYKGDGKRMALLFPEVLPEIHRLLRPGGALAFFGRWPTFYRWAIAAEEVGFRQREEVIRDLRRALIPAGSSLARVHDTVYIGCALPEHTRTFRAGGLREPYMTPAYRRGGSLEHGFQRHALTGRIPSNGTCFRPHPAGAWPRDLRSSNRRPAPRLHDGQKPLADCEWLVKLLTNEGDLVLDPFCGAGTIPLACANLGRRFVAIDIEQKWVTVTQDRLLSAARGRTLILPLEVDHEH